jgi:rubredoxin
MPVAATEDQTQEANLDVGTVVWYSAEQITTGRRDAIRTFPAAEEPDPSTKDSPAPGGFAITWQEDPKGLKTGKGRGPGAGMSGAGVNHKTDIWYTYLKFNEFEAIDTLFVPGSEDADNTIFDVDETIAVDEEKTTPHALHLFHPPVRISDNAVCKQRTPTPIMAHTHIDGIDCDYTYEGGTNNEPILWEDLPAEWTCPKCGRTKDTFNNFTTVIGTRNEGAPYCDLLFASNPRVNGDGEIVSSTDPEYATAYYTADNLGTIPLDGNTGASRANLSLVNWKGATLALIAYEETKGIGVGGDKEAAAMEQTAPFPLVNLKNGAVYKDADGNIVEENTVGWTGGFTNRDCRSCHFDNIVPKDRVIPVANETVCTDPVSAGGKGGIWKKDLEAYYPYTGYPFSTVEPVEALPVGVSYAETAAVHCVKFEKGTPIYPKDYAQTEEANALYVLPEHLPGWHSRNIDCTKCHLPYMTKDLDQDTVPDRVDLCLSTSTGDTMVDLVSTSDRYGCSADQTVGDPDNNKDAEPRYRHGKDIYYHHFVFDDFGVAGKNTIGHGDKINLENPDWIAPGTIDSHDENARRVRVVPNPMYDEDTAPITLGLLYKQGKDGQGAPADAFFRVFKHGFAITDIVPGAVNLSSSTPYIYQDESETATEPGEVDYQAGDGSSDTTGGHNTPKIEQYYWTNANLDDTSGYWKADADGVKLWTADTVPDLDDNPFDNVFSTRMEIRGNFIAVAFAYSTNWAAAKKAKDHYDFFMRTSNDGGATWTLPLNVTELKNHEESVADCRLLLPPETLDPLDVPVNELPDGFVAPDSDTFNPNTLFVAIGTKENTPQPAPNQTELEESEIFLDLSYARSLDRGVTFEGVPKVNPKYVPDSLRYIDNVSGLPTENEFDANGIANQENPAYAAEIGEFDWLAKGDAFQGDVQVVTDPAGLTLHAVWEQELALDEESSMSHFQGTDVWYRKITYAPPPVPGDLDNDRDIDTVDYSLFKVTYGKCEGNAAFNPAADYDGDNCVTLLDYRTWYGYYKNQ